MSIAVRSDAAVMGLGLVLGLNLALAAPASSAEPLVVDLSSREIAITTGFAGTELLLFGAKEAGGSVVVVIRGPRRDEQVRKRERVAGMWVNGAAMTFHNLPAFYHVAATGPLEDIAPEATLAERRIGADRLALTVAAEGPADVQSDYRRALIRNKTRQRLYGYDPAGVKVIGDRLFRATVTFPVNVPTGPYQVEVYLFKDGREVGRRDSTLVVHKVGLEAGVYNFAHQRSALYGAIAILIALGSGWLAGAAFRT